MHRFSHLILLGLALMPISKAAKIPALPSGWTYVGCLYEGEGQRMLNSSEYHKTQMCGGWGYMTLFSTTATDPSGGGSKVSSSSSATAAPSSLTLKTPTQAAPAVAASTAPSSSTPAAASASASGPAKESVKTIEKVITTTAEGGSTVVATTTLSTETERDSISESANTSSTDDTLLSQPSIAVDGGGPGSGSVLSTSTSTKEEAQQTLPTLGSPTQALTTGNPRLREPSQGVIFGNISSNNDVIPQSP
ncbi:hypothetical protein I316_06184 [Kwoniella heveanensis BCC8398]|uniref:Uncharacterized protein n=1 Tax=Kwoniella heveanensis BCC8398 TaxID=1296120 RepID=A0A1B9GLZ4_9TREE|nr:hypothetical protein I316_06184 [Kwoniella heveanensis BCC8398]